MVDRRSLHGRLTLTFTAALLLTLFVAGAGAFGLVRWSQRTEVDGHLVRIAATLSSWARWHDGVFQPHAIDAQAAARLNGTLAESSIFGRDGALLFSTTPAIPEVLRRAVHQVHGVASTGDFPEAQNVWRASIAPVVRNGKTQGMSVAWHDVLVDRSFEQRIALIFVTGAPILAIFSLPIAGFAARRGLGPLEDMVGAVEEIEAHALSRRIPEARMPLELERFAHAFNRMLDRLENAFARERQFTADASHELRAPLSVIGATAEYALETPRDGVDYRRALRSIGLEANDLERLMQELLASARAEAAVPAVQAPCDIGAVTFDVVEELYPLARKRTLSVEHPRVDEVLVALDAEAMTRLVRAVLDNAIRHAHEGGHVGVTVETSEREATLEIRDDGPGFSELALRHATERFWRGDVSRGREQQGTGLGLSIACSIAAHAGGKLELSNAALGGALVRVTLPRAKTHLDVDMTSHTSRFA